MKRYSLEILLKMAVTNNDQLKIMSEQFNKLNLYIDHLNKSISDRDDQIKQLLEINKQISIANSKEKNDYQQMLDELSFINEDYRTKLASVYDEKNSKDRIIHDLNLQLSNQKHQTQFFISEHQQRLNEFERIKNLKGYKLLMKYYKMRDDALMRNRRRILKAPKIQPNEISISEPSLSWKK